ncbi:MAG: class I SAM-dependent methyltransferase, partial [Acidobacteriota bacterium]
MDESTRRALIALSHRFYERDAQTFDATRRRPWPGWHQVLEAWLQRGPLKRPMRVLDAGCGNGRFGHFLAAQSDLDIAYTGVDSSQGLVTAARASAGFPSYFVVQEIESWLESRGPGEPAFDLIVIFGVLHHIPGRDRRRRIMGTLAQLLAPGGLLAATWWMLHQSPRIEQLRLPWHTAPEIEPSQLEMGDTLLSWQGQGVRYCHFPAQEELESFLELPGLEH